MTKSPSNNIKKAALDTPTDLKPEGVKKITEAINPLVADLIALWVKTKNYHWHMSGRHFRDYHRMLDVQSEELLETVDPLAERVRKLGGKTITSLAQIVKLTNVVDNDEAQIAPRDMLLDLMQENKKMAHNLREAHDICEENEDIGGASLIEDYINQTERRTWFLFEATREVETGNAPANDGKKK
ncbi:starvation-inducible DNA-binding protein [Neolewinella xylanilytica]|uniref:Starvation-inducible DNA-binding protein n=1 Tax=Neolewinella xylanilytica TaxID=1514080 RepID=A0A2S6I2N1_9BACT|nr:DNA starvation/stationary phase protection protein [Neolewinella xylanilytica]PPK85442.1 starvation-inducible DNA-binding protein [Neolewinella xylanilytica]